MFSLLDRNTRVLAPPIACPAGTATGVGDGGIPDEVVRVVVDGEAVPLGDGGTRGLTVSP